jgi:hypothetical protein
MNSDGDIRELPAGESPKPDEILLNDTQAHVLKTVLNHKGRRIYYSEVRRGKSFSEAFDAAIAKQGAKDLSYMNRYKRRR